MVKERKPKQVIYLLLFLKEKGKTWAQSDCRWCEGSVWASFSCLAWAGITGSLACYA